MGEKWEKTGRMGGQGWVGEIKIGDLVSPKRKKRKKRIKSSAEINLEITFDLTQSHLM